MSDNLPIGLAALAKLRGAVWLCDHEPTLEQSRQMQRLAIRVTLGAPVHQRWWFQRWPMFNKRGADKADMLLAIEEAEKRLQLESEDLADACPPRPWRRF